jgi:hypothetical protein
VQLAEAPLLVEVVDLDHDPVDLVVELGALRLPGNAPLGDLVDRLEPLRVGIRAEPVLPQPEQHLPLRLRELAFPDAEAVDPERERPLRRDPGVELPERARRGVARVRSRFLAGRRLRLVEPGEAREREVDLAAHLEARRRVFAVRDEHRERHRLHRTEVPRHVLTAKAVATRRASDEAAVLVDERDRRPVDLRLDHVGDGFVGAEPLPHVVRPLGDRLARRDLLERAHRLEVLDLGEPRGGLAPDALRRRVVRDELRVLFLDRLQLVEERVERAIRDLRIVEDVVTMVVVRDEPAQLGHPRGDVDLLRGRHAAPPPCGRARPGWHGGAARRGGCRPSRPRR